MADKNTNLHPEDWSVRELMNYCLEHHIGDPKLVGSLEKEKLVAMVLKDEIDKE